MSGLDTTDRLLYKGESNYMLDFGWEQKKSVGVQRRFMSPDLWLGLWRRNKVALDSLLLTLSSG